jgi:hypothetical protein
VTPIDIIREPAQRRRRLAEARGLVPRLLAQERSALAACGRPTVIAGSQLTSTNVAVIFLACPGEPPCAVLKVPTMTQASEGLTRETDTLAALHADGRVGDWRRLIPLPLADGTLDARRDRVDAPLGGRTVIDRLTEEKRAQRLLEAAADAIDVLHRTTSTTVAVDRALTARWIDQPVATLLARGGARGLEARLHALRDELHHALVGRRFRAGWIHGDYWLGNVLFDGSENHLRGVVDWDAAGEPELPIVDLRRRGASLHRLPLRAAAADRDRAVPAPRVGESGVPGATFVKPPAHSPFEVSSGADGASSRIGRASARPCGARRARLGRRDLGVAARARRRIRRCR